jgi:hypothetical protein
MFTTLVRWSDAEVPNDCVFDCVGQRFFEGNQESSNRDGFPSWMGATKAGLLGTPTGSVSTRKRVALRSAKGQKQTFGRPAGNVRFVPIADSPQNGSLPQRTKGKT